MIEICHGVAQTMDRFLKVLSGRALDFMCGFAACSAIDAVARHQDELYPIWFYWAGLAVVLFGFAARPTLRRLAGYS